MTEWIYGLRLWDDTEIHDEWYPSEQLARRYRQGYECQSALIRRSAGPIEVLDVSTPNPHHTDNTEGAQP